MLTNKRAAMSPSEALIEFLYLTPVGVMKFSPDGSIDMANPVAAQLLMPVAPERDMSNLYRVLSVVVPDLRGRIEAFQPPTGSVFDQMQIKLPGSHRVLTLTINKIDHDTLMAVVQDITRAIEQETRSRDDQQRFRAIFENVRDYAIYTVGIDGRIDTWNRSLERVGGWQAADVVGAPIALFFPQDPADQASSVSLLDRAREFGTAELDGWRVRKDGSRFWGNTVAACLPDQDGPISGYVLVTRDLTERKQMEDRLVLLSTTDAMTGALNRRASEAKLEEIFNGWLRSGRPFSLLMIDCDHFKSINDTWGHDAGDEALTALVRICQDKLRDQDMIFRWGGEEFLVILPGSRPNIIPTVAERLRSALAAAEITHGGRRIRITVSIGVATVCDADRNGDDVVRRADQALYSAKHAGRNKVMEG